MNASLLVDMQSLLITLALITPRTLVCLMVLPGFGMRTMTGIMRNSVAIAIVLPAALPTFTFVQDTPPDYLMAGVLILKEAAIGMLLGVLMAIPIWVAQSIGSILDIQRSPIQIPANNSSQDRDASAIGALLLQAVVLVMIEAGLFVALTRILLESYGTWPAFNLTSPFEAGHFEIIIKRFGEFFWYIVVYGGPVLRPLMLVDLAFALIGVFAPNLQVSFASSPIKSVGGLFILLLYWPIFSYYVAGDFAHMLDLVASMLQIGPRK